MRPEYDLARLKGGVRGKYARGRSDAGQAVVIDPELAKVFPTTKAVNDALRELLDRRSKAS